MFGVPRIKIPIKPNEVTIDKILPYLPTVYYKFMQNRNKIHNDWEYYNLMHSILSKTRVYGDTEINNIVLEPHIFSIISFKLGYIFGNPIKYAQNKDIDTDDIEYLNKYNRDVNKSTIDQKVAEWIYATGVGYYFTEPKPLEEKIDIEFQSPYDLYEYPADMCTKVYSSYKGNKPLFDVLYTRLEEITENGMTDTYDLISIYTKDMYYEIKTKSGVNFGYEDITKAESRGIYRELPLTEKRVNTSGIGIVELGRKMQDSIDNISSNVMDNIEEIVNAIWVYINCDLGDTPEEATEKHRSMKRNGAIAFKTPPDSPHESKLDVIYPELNIKDILLDKADLKQTLYDVCGCPLASSEVTSGGDTGEARAMGNGWENAYNYALKEQTSFLEADYELLKKIMFICKNMPNSKIDNLNASDIDIKYCINMSNNMLVKSQSYVNFVTTGMPYKMALQKANISNDPEIEGKMIEEYKQKQEYQTTLSAETSDTVEDI